MEMNTCLINCGHQSLLVESVCKVIVCPRICSIARGFIHFLLFQDIQTTSGNGEVSAGHCLSQPLCSFLESFQLSLMKREQETEVPGAAFCPLMSIPMLWELSSLSGQVSTGAGVELCWRPAQCLLQSVICCQPLSR